MARACLQISRRIFRRHPSAYLHSPGIRLQRAKGLSLCLFIERRAAVVEQDNVASFQAVPFIQPGIVVRPLPCCKVRLRAVILIS